MGRGGILARHPEKATRAIRGRRRVFARGGRRFLARLVSQVDEMQLQREIELPLYARGGACT